MNGDRKRGGGGINERRKEGGRGEKWINVGGRNNHPHMLKYHHACAEGHSVRVYTAIVHQTPSLVT